jgi:hypothetical protein
MRRRRRRSSALSTSASSRSANATQRLQVAHRLIDIHIVYLKFFVPRFAWYGDRSMMRSGDLRAGLLLLCEARIDRQHDRGLELRQGRTVTLHFYSSIQSLLLDIDRIRIARGGAIGGSSGRSTSTRRRWVPTILKSLASRTVSGLSRHCLVSPCSIALFTMNGVFVFFSLPLAHCTSNERSLLVPNNTSRVFRFQNHLFIIEIGREQLSSKRRGVECAYQGVWRQSQANKHTTKQRNAFSCLDLLDVMIDWYCVCTLCFSNTNSRTAQTYKHLITCHQLQEHYGDSPVELLSSF